MSNIPGTTNVRSSRFGAGAVDGIGRDLGRFVVTTMALPWRITEPRIDAIPAAVLMVESMDVDVIERQIATVPPCETVLAVGGGQAIDLGKYLAWRRGSRLVTVPTVLSVDAFVTPAAGVRRHHRVEYVGESTPDPLVIDYDLLRTAPAELNIAGVGDLISIQTACVDWERAAAAGRSEYPFDPHAVATARRILGDILSRGTAIRACTDEGLRAIVEGYMRVNTVCLPAGHYRIEEGSEHYVFYELEERLQRPFIHGWVVGLGVHLMSRLQGHRHHEIVAFMDEVGLPYHPRDLDISRESLRASLLALRTYVERRPDLWWTAINERDLTPDWVDAALDSLHFRCEVGGNHP